MIFEIELNIEQQGSPVFVSTPTLSGQTYRLNFQWVIKPYRRTGAWYLDIGSAIYGIKIVSGINLLDPYDHLDALPPGKLGVYRNSGRGSKPSFSNFGIDKEFTLIYEEP